MRRTPHVHGPVPVTLAELTAGLVWPTICRAAGMAAQPPRLFLGFAAVVVIRLLGALFDWLRGDVTLSAPLGGGERGVFEGLWGSLMEWAGGLFSLSTWVDGLGSRGGLGDHSAALMLTWGAYLREYPIESLVVLVVVILPAWTIAGGGICRMIATDLAGHYNMGVREGLSFSLRRVKTGIAALLLPVILVVLLVLSLMLSGRVLLSEPLSLVGALLYGVTLCVGLLATLLTALTLLTNPLMLPAVQVEGTDVLDAMQRAFAYLLGRPGRFLLYLLVAVATGVVAVTIAGMLINGTLMLTRAAATAGFSDAHIAHLFGPGGEGASHGLLGFWERLLVSVLDGYVLAFFFSVSTATYMVLRRVNDDQDISEIWMPGMIEGTMAPEDPEDVEALPGDAPTMADGEG
ncbi:MAG: hypothetical protein KDA21_01075 [Phycisphaerales bacterium]|nr:hypothetical protein [Phycisphaerales bacterium]